MRGKVYDAIDTMRLMRITPAYAGKSFCPCKFHSVGQGSPPPMRGKVLVHMLLFQYHGITPAYAGKRMGGFNVAQDFEDHPRLCGEK